MLLATEWHPWFSYEWWHEIGVPALGALGSIVVGVGVVGVALNGNRIAASVAAREASSTARSELAQQKADRVEFAILVRRWIDRSLEEALVGVEKHKIVAGYVWASELSVELNVMAAAMSAPNAVELKAILSKSLESVRDRIPARDQQLIASRRSVMLKYLQAWVRDPDTWLILDDDEGVSRDEWLASVRARGLFEESPADAEAFDD